MGFTKWSFVTEIIGTIPAMMARRKSSTSSFKIQGHIKKTSSSSMDSQKIKVHLKVHLTNAGEHNEYVKTDAASKKM
jgi:hypothetical protein